MAATRMGEAKQLRLELWRQGIAIHLTREGWDEPTILYALGREKPQWLRRALSLPADVQDRLAKDGKALLESAEVRAGALRGIVSTSVLFGLLFELTGLTPDEQTLVSAMREEEAGRYSGVQAPVAEEPAEESASPRPSGRPRFTSLDTRARMDRVKAGVALGLLRRGWPAEAVLKMLGSQGSKRWLDNLRSLPPAEQDSLESEAGSDFQPPE